MEWGDVDGVQQPIRVEPIRRPGRRWWTVFSLRSWGQSGNRDLRLVAVNRWGQCFELFRETHWEEALAKQERLQRELEECDLDVLVRPLRGTWRLRRGKMATRRGASTLTTVTTASSRRSIVGTS